MICYCDIGKTKRGKARVFSNPEEIEREMRRMQLKKENEDEEDSDESEDEPKGSTKKDMKKVVAESSSDEEESDEEESDEEEEKGKPKGVSSLIEIENPNRVVKRPGKLKIL